MLGQNTFGLSLAFAVLVSIATPISGQHNGLLSANDCVLNTRKLNPLNRETFFQCTTTGFTLMRCPETMVFEASSSSCVEKNIPPIYIYVPNCARIEFGAFVPAYCSCTKYWRCVFQRAFLFSCGPGTMWSQELLTCVWPWQAKCNSHAQCSAYDIKNELLAENIQHVSNIV